MFKTKKIKKMSFGTALSCCFHFLSDNWLMASLKLRNDRKKYEYIAKWRNLLAQKPPHFDSTTQHQQTKRKGK